MQTNNLPTWGFRIAAIAVFVVVTYLALQSPGNGNLTPENRQTSTFNELSALPVEIDEAPSRGPESINSQEIANPIKDIKKPNIFCFSASEHKPLSGVVMFRNSKKPATPPSSHTGELILDNLGSKTKRTFWMPGWEAKHYAIGEELPEEILLSKADANLVVRIVGMRPEWRIAKSKMQITNQVSGGNEAWQPMLRRDQFDILRADRIPAGEYDIYVWVAKDGKQPQVIKSDHVEVKAAQTTEIQVFATGDWPDEH